MTIPTAEVIRLARIGRQAEKRREVRNGCLGLLGQMIVHILVGGWLFMLAVGVAHHEWIPSLPTIGYWWSVLLAWLLRGALAQLPSTSGKKASST